MTEFLSEESVLFHKAYVKELRLKHSIIEKSLEGISGKNVAHILGMRLPKNDVSYALRHLPEIELHELYFSSFSPVQNSASATVRESYGSEGALLNEIYRIATSLPYGFVTVGVYRGRVRIWAHSDPLELLRWGVPLLALDVCEHAYFRDYGFDRSSYLINALSRLDLSRINLSVTTYQ